MSLENAEGSGHVSGLLETLGATLPTTIAEGTIIPARIPPDVARIAANSRRHPQLNVRQSRTLVSVFAYANAFQENFGVKINTVSGSPALQKPTVSLHRFGLSDLGEIATAKYRTSFQNAGSIRVSKTEYPEKNRFPERLDTAIDWTILPSSVGT